MTAAINSTGAGKRAYPTNFIVPSTPTATHTLSLHDALPILFADAGEHIEHFTPVRFRVLNAVRRDDRQSVGAGKINQLVIDLFFATNEMPLELDEDIFLPESIDDSPSWARTFGT